MKLVDRRTGKFVEVPDDQATGLFKSGLYGIPRGGTLPVTTPGIIGTVDAADATKAVQDGLTIPKEADFRAAQQEARYGGLGGAAAAAGVGAARGAAEAFGVPLDAAALGLAGMGSAQSVFDGKTVQDPYRGSVTLSPAEALRESLGGLQSAHPYASMGGELAGLAGASAIGGGLLGGAGAVGEAGAEALGIGRIGTGMLRGAAEGAALGVPQALNEVALGDTDATAEKVVAGMGHGAFLGAGLGAAFSGLGVATDAARDQVGRWVGKLAPRDVEALATKTFGYAPDGLGERVQKAYAKLSASAAGKDADVVNRFTELSPEGAEARRVGVFDAPKIQDEAQREIRSQVDNLLRSGDLVSAEARGQLKADYVSKAVKRGNEAEAADFAKQQIGRLIEGADSELFHADGVAPQMTKSLETLSRAAYRAEDAIGKGDNASLFVELDNLKRSVQKLTNTGYRSVRNIADPLEQLSARRTVDWMRGAAEELRGGLENEELWGRAAADQRTINAAWTKQIDASQRFHKALTTETMRDPENPYVRLRGADPGKVDTYVRNLTNPNNDLTHTAVRDFVDGTRELADAIHKSYELPPEKSAEVTRVKDAATAFGRTVTKAEKGLVLANQYRALTEGTTDSLSAVLGTVGGVVGGLPGGVLGAAAGAVANPGRVVAQLASVERLMMKVDTRVSSSVRDFFRGGSRRPAALHEAATPDGFDKAVKLLSESVDADGNITPAGRAKIANAIGDLGEGAPNLSVAVGIKAMEIATFLAGKVPPGLRNPFEMFPGEEPPLVSDSERETFARYVKAAEDPMSVVDHLARGDVTPEESEVLKTLYPRLYEQIQEQIDAMAREGQAKDKPLDYQQRIEYGVLFAVRTDATMDPAVLSMVASARKQRGGRRGGGGAGGMQAPTRLRPIPNLAPRFQTTFEAASSRRKGGLL